MQQKNLPAMNPSISDSSQLKIDCIDKNDTCKPYDNHKPKPYKRYKKQESIEKESTNKIREDITDTTKIQRTIKGYHEQLYA